MGHSIFLGALALIWSVGASAMGSQTCSHNGKPYALALHGGAGAWQLSADKREKVYRLVRDLLAKGEAKLVAGGTSLDVVEMVVRGMEDSGFLNAGKGSVKNSDGVVEMDASIMEGAKLGAGAVAAVKRLKNPIHAARLVMEKSRHVLMAADGAERLVIPLGAQTVDPGYHSPDELIEGSVPPDSTKYGTVGAVALDCLGNLASATSTGGIRGKLPGRIGDSPVIGAGTYADNTSCAVSGTGEGEFFIRSTAARDVAALMELQGVKVSEAADKVVAKIARLGGTGGLIAVDRHGNVATPFNTPGMLRGYLRPGETPFVGIER